MSKTKKISFKRIMHARQFAIVLLSFVLAGNALNLRADSPNIILIVADDLGYGELGCYGQRLIKTPNIDRMAKEGKRFTNFYAGCTVCAPSRSVLMTGQHAGHTWVRGNAGNDISIQSLRDRDVTVAEVLKSAGYRTGLCGKWGLGEFTKTRTENPGAPTRQGFDFFFGYLSQHHAHNYYPAYLWKNEQQVHLENDVIPTGYQNPNWPFDVGYSSNRKQYSHDLIMKEALEFIQRNHDHPFFLYLPVTVPHANNEGTKGTGNGQEIPDYGIYADRNWPDPDKGQAAMVSHLDQGVGQILASLKKLKIDDDTVVIFTSDNGPHDEGGHNLDRFNPSGPLRGQKRDLYEGGIRVPLIVRWPNKIAANSLSAHIGYFGDFMATAAELAGVAMPENLDSISMLPELTGIGGQQQHDYLYWEFYEGRGKQAVRAGDWKAVRMPMFSGETQLFNLLEDIGESNDVASAHPEIVARLEAQLEQAHRPNANWKTSKVSKTSGEKNSATSSRQKFTWTPKWSVARDRPGYALVEGVEHFPVLKPSLEAGAYQHHPQIAIFQGHFYASWSAHRSGEDGPGQRVMFAHSADGQKWSTTRELFPAIDQAKVSTTTGRALTALRFVETNDKLFAIAEAHQNTGYTSTDRLMTAAPQSEVRSEQFPKRSRQGLGRLVREVTCPNQPGTIYWLNDDKPLPVDGHADFEVATQKNLLESAAIRKRLATPLHAPTWDFKNNSTEIRTADGTLLTEPATYRTPAGKLARLWRAQDKSFRMYGQTSTDGENWSAPVITPIPDAPAKTVAVNLDSETVALIGNQVFNKRGTRRDPLIVALSKNGLDFDRAFSLRWRTPKFRTPRQQEEPDGRGTGFQYPSAAVFDGYLWVIYSVNKEAIDVSRIKLESLQNFSPCGFFNAACIADVVKESEARFKGVTFDQDAVLAGTTTERFADGSCRLKMVWHLKAGRRANRFIHICDEEGKVLRQGNQNRALFGSVTGERTVLDSVYLPSESLRDASFVAAGFYDAERKSAPVTKAGAPTGKHRLQVLSLKP